MEGRFPSSCSWTVYGGCRASTPELDGLGVHVVTGVDVGSEKGVDALSSVLQGVQVDLLINNAGVLEVERLEDLCTAEGTESLVRQFQINSIGPLRCT